MIAIVGAVVGTSVTWLSRVIPETPAKTPISAEAIGSPIATSEPNVNASTTSAIARPTTSLCSVSGLLSFCPSGPPAEVLSPAAFAGIGLVEDRLAVVDRDVRRATGSGRPRCTRSSRSLEICAAPSLSNGLITFATYSSPFSPSTVLSIGVLYLESVIFAPSGARRTIGLEPLAWSGKPRCEQVGHLLGAGAGEADVVAGLRAERSGQRDEADGDDEPREQHREAVSHAQLAEAVERARHRLTLSQSAHLHHHSAGASEGASSRRSRRQHGEVRQVDVAVGRRPRRPAGRTALC